MAEAKPKNENISKQSLYHYTDDKGIEGIKETGVIHSSTDIVRDAAFGEAVYFTEKGPKSSTKALMTNNYDAMIPHDKSRVDNYVRIKKSDLPDAVQCPIGRNVWVVPRDVNLSDTKHSIHTRNKKK